MSQSPRLSIYVSVPFTSGSSLQLYSFLYFTFLYFTLFQFPLHRDPRCNRRGVAENGRRTAFQFPLHRDPRCNLETRRIHTVFVWFQFPLHRDPRCNSIQLIDSAMGKEFQFPLHRDPRCNGVYLIRTCMKPSFSSLYIGILAATFWYREASLMYTVSVPFTSGSSLQPKTHQQQCLQRMFQFPLHRDPRCNPPTNMACHFSPRFQFPLHRDPRCNESAFLAQFEHRCFSSLYIGILAATVPPVPEIKSLLIKVSVPFTSGSSLQH